MCARRIGLLLLLVLALSSLGVASAQGDAVVRMVYFYSTDCDHCMRVINEVLRPLVHEYGDRVEVKAVEIADPAGYELMLKAEELFSIDPERKGIPILIVGPNVLIGEDEISGQLRCLLDSCLGAGGTAWPAIEGLERVAVGLGGASSLALDIAPGGALEPCEEESAVACESPNPVWVAYFYEVGCQECSRAEYDIRYVRSKYPQLIVEEFDAQHDALLLQWLDDRFGVPEEQQLTTPILFIGDDYLIGPAIDADSLADLAEKYRSSGSSRVWEEFGGEESSAAMQRIIDRFESFGVFAVAFFGLLDGLNPCAFATIIFFVSYLTLSGRQGKEVLAVGAAFTLGVFVAYLSVGVGFSKVLNFLDSVLAGALGVEGKLLTTVGRWFIGLTAVLCAVLAVLSIVDFFKARRGQLSSMALNLPHRLRLRINAVIRSGRSARSYVGAAFVIGVVVSFLELACTGQVYGPTILAVMSIPSMRVRALPYLLLYNVMFVTPLIVVFVLAYFGVSSKELTKFFQKHAPAMKLGMAFLFLTLAVWLVSSLLV